ncbi:hypothetical protein, partial [Mycobacterium sp.]|uniref:hypothetical protein n=1 Tax=Mycobacterium sp. TaxID=1785 RepID=UPI003F944C47
ASTAGPSVLSPGQPFPAGRAVAIVLGYWYAGDGGGGLFYWDASSDARPDGGTVFAIACHPLGRWIRLIEGPMSVKWFGARLDGEHNDRDAVQPALNSGAGVIIIPPGICAIYDAPLSIPAGTTLMGAGSGVTTLQQCTPGQEVVRITDAPNAALVGMAVVSSGAAHAVHALAVPNPDVEHLDVEHVTFRDVWVQPGFGSPGISITAVDRNTFHATAHGLSNDQIVQLSAGSPHLGASTNLAFSVSGNTISGIGDTGPMDHGLKAGDPVQFVDVEDANILPQGLKTFTKYYVVNPTATTFQVSAKRGGRAIAFTGGTGLPLIVYVWPMVPGGFEPCLEYFVVNATADSFQLSLTRPGNPIVITDAPASTCKVGVVYAGILLESAGKNLYSPRIRDCKIDGGQQSYTDGSARHGIRAISTPDPEISIPANVVGATIIGGETANLKAGVSTIAGAEIIAVAHHVYNISDATGGGTAFAASGNNALQGSDNRIEGGAGAVERAVLFYPNATGCSLRATPGFQTWQILDLSGTGSNSWWLALDSNVQNRQAGAFTYQEVGFYGSVPDANQPLLLPKPKAPGTYGSTEQQMLYSAYSALQDVGLLP